VLFAPLAARGKGKRSTRRCVCHSLSARRSQELFFFLGAFDAGRGRGGRAV